MELITIGEGREGDVGLQKAQHRQQLTSTNNDQIGILD
jgi:hypothetical protein